MSLRQPSLSMLDMYSAGSLTTSSVETATPPAAVVRLALDRQRLLIQSLRHYHPTPAHTVSAPTAAATNLLDPSAFCLPPAVSIPIFPNKEATEK